MTGSRIRALATGAIAAGLLLAGSVQAQAPVSPSRLAAGAGSAAPAGQAPAKTPSEALPPADTPPPRQAAVAVASLGEVEGPPAGTLETGNGGLGASLWNGAPKAEAEAILDRLPLSSPVPAIRSLARRILLTTAPAPVGDALFAFTAVRLRRLLDAGWLADAAQLAQQADVPNDADFDRARADALLYAGDPQPVCGPLTARRDDSAEPFWIRLRAYCYAASGDEAALGLTKAILQARGLGDASFDVLLGGLHGRLAKLPAIAAPDALTAFLIRQDGLALPLEIGEALGTPGLLLAARAKANPPAERLQAAERLVRSGALNGDELTAIADAQSFSREQFATEHAQLLQMPFFQGQALLRQAVRQAAPDAQAALIFDALASAHLKGLLGVAAVLQRDALTKLAPSAADRPLTGLIARALLLNGEADRAAAWAATLNPALPADAALKARLEAAIHLAGPSAARDAGLGASFAVLARQVTAKTTDQAMAALVLNLYAELKEPLPAGFDPVVQQTLKTNWPGARPQAVLRKLAEALHAPGNRGEALSLILIAMGPQGGADMAPDITARMVRDLIRLGAGSAARELAISALIRFEPAETPPAAPSGSASL